MALISKMTYARSAGKELLIDLTIPADTVGSNYFMVGWDLNQTTNASYNQLVHGFYWSNYSFDTYEKGGRKGGTGNYVASTDYQMKIVLKAVGAEYYIRGGFYDDWTLVNETSGYSDTPLRIGFHQNSHEAQIHKITVSPGSNVNSGASLASEQNSAGYIFENKWVSDFSNTATAKTPVPDNPVGLIVVAAGDTSIDLSWNYSGSDETGFKIERCAGSGCSDFTQVGMSSANQTSHVDSNSLQPATYYRYRVRAYKTSTHSWNSDYSNQAEDLTFSASATDLTAVAQNSRTIKLEWNDVADDEDGYEIQVKVWNGRFITTATVTFNENSYFDRVGIDELKSYTYRVRPFRGSDKSPFSNPATATTPGYEEGDNTCP
jgi:hypothetical protein